MPLLTKKDLDEIRGIGLKSIYPEKTKIAVGMSTCGRASGAEEVLQTIQNDRFACQNAIQIIYTNSRQGAITAIQSIQDNLS